MAFNWFNFVWTIINLLILVLIITLVVFFIRWLVQTQRRLVRIEAAIEELRSTRKAGDR